MSFPSFEHMPSVPSATLTPWRRSSGTGQMPEPSFRFETGLWTTVTPRSRTSSMSARRQPDPVLEADARGEKADRVEVLGQRAAVQLLARDGLHARLEHVDVDHQVELVGKRGAAGEHLVGAALGPGRRRADRDPLVGPVVAVDGVPDERLPLVPRRRAARARSGRSARARRGPRRARRSRGRRGRSSPSAIRARRPRSR